MFLPCPGGPTTPVVRACGCDYRRGGAPHSCPRTSDRSGKSSVALASALTYRHRQIASREDSADLQQAPLCSRRHDRKARFGTHLQRTTTSLCRAAADHHRAQPRCRAVRAEPSSPRTRNARAPCAAVARKQEMPSAIAGRASPSFGRSAALGSRDAALRNSTANRQVGAHAIFSLAHRGSGAIDMPADRREVHFDGTSVHRPRRARTVVRRQACPAHDPRTRR